MATLVVSGRSRIGQRSRLETAERAREAARLGWVDTVRVGLTVLVIAHHAGQAYGPGGWWPVMEAERAWGLGAFFATNAAFFMGLFFLIAGSFVPAAYDRKGATRFLRDRLVRLGVPLLVFGLLLFPPVWYQGYREDGGQLLFWDFYVQEYLGGWQVEFGHLWFVAHLLVYAVGYAAWRRWTRRRPTPEAARGALPGHRAILLYALGLAAVTFVVRVWYPIDRWERLLGVVPSEVAHLPQYLSLFVVGVVAGHRDWLRRFPTGTGLTWLRIGLAAVALRYVYTLVAGDRLPLVIAIGGADWRSLVWSAWEAVICVGLCVGLLVLARERFATQGARLRALSANAYAAYLMHVWPVVALQTALVGVALAPATKFALVTVIGVPASFLVAALVRRLPLVRRVV